MRPGVLSRFVNFGALTVKVVRGNGKGFEIRSHEPALAGDHDRGQAAALRPSRQGPLGESTQPSGLGQGEIQLLLVLSVAGHPLRPRPCPKQRRSP